VAFIPWLVDTVTRKLRRAAPGELIDKDYLPTATTSDQGAMSAADKTKLDGVAASAAAVSSSTPADVAAAGAAGASTSAARADHVHAHGSLAGGALHSAATSVAAGFMSAADKTAHDAHLAASAPHSGHELTSAKGQPSGYASLNSSGRVPIAQLASGTPDGTKFIRDDQTLAVATQVSSATPAAIAASGAAGVATDAARADHVHAHGVQAGGTAHADATRTTDGFATASHVAQLEDDLPDVQEIANAAGVVLPDSDDGNGPELIWMLTPGRWRCGNSTNGFKQPFFYAEGSGVEGTFANGGTCELHCVIGAPTSGSNVSNWPAAEDVGGYLVSQHWDTGPIIPPAAMLAGAVLDIHLFGRMQVGATRNWTVILDPDPDVMHAVSGNNGVTLAYRDCVLGQVHGEQFGVAADLEDSGDNVLVCRYTTHGLAEDAIVRLTKGDLISVGEDGIVGDVSNYEGAPLYVVTSRPVLSVTSANGTKNLTATAFKCLEVGDDVELTSAGTSGLTIGSYTVTAKPSASTITVGGLPGNATASVSNVEVFIAGDDLFWLSKVDTADVGWPDFVAWDADSGATAVTNLSTSSGTRDLSHPSFADAVVGQLFELIDVTTSGLTAGVYEITAKPASTTITCDDLPAAASASVSTVDGELYADWSRKAFVTINASRGSHKRVAFSFELSTLTTDWEALHLHMRCVVDSAAQNEDTTGAQWTAKLRRFSNHEGIGPSGQTQPVAEGPDAVEWPAIRISRSYPGTGYSASGAFGSGAFLWQGKTNYDGSGTVAYVSSAHDLSGLYSEIFLDTDIATTGNQQMASVKTDYSPATATLLKVGGQIVAEVLDYVPQRRMMRVRDLSDATRIKSGDTVTWELYRKIGSSWNTTPHSSGTFTAGLVRAGPLPIPLALRMAMSGAQDGTTVAEINAGFATLTRRKSI